MPHGHGTFQRYTDRGALAMTPYMLGFEDGNEPAPEGSRRSTARPYSRQPSGAATWLASRMHATQRGNKQR